jgi:hypothetical protein
LKLRKKQSEFKLQLIQNLTVNRIYLEFQVLIKLLILPVRFSIPGVGVQIESGAAPDTTSKDLLASAAPQTPARIKAFVVTSWRLLLSVSLSRMMKTLICLEMKQKWRKQLPKSMRLQRRLLQGPRRKNVSNSQAVVEWCYTSCITLQ